MLAKSLSGIEPRVLLMSLASVVGITGLASYRYLFKADLRSLVERRDARSRSLTEVTAESRAMEGRRIDVIKSEVKALESRLYGKSARLPPGQMVSYIIGALDAIAVRHHVRLVGVKPGTGGKVLAFEEVPFDIAVSGDFFGLYGWLQRAEEELRPMVVKQFHLVPLGEKGKARMELRVVSYRPPA